MTSKEVYARAIEQFGLNKQIVKCIEELSELQKELCKQSLGQGNLENIIEEIADVEIMLEQMKIGLSIRMNDLIVEKSKKVCRLSKKLDEMDRQGKRQENKHLAYIEKKCQQCRYTVMTDIELQALGREDPCDTCRDLSNWKPREE